MLENKNYELWQGDCLELMKTIPDKSIDMILCDLPYGTTWNCWDKIIPMEDLWDAYKRVITDVGVIVLFGTQPFTSLLVCSNLEMFKYNLIWKKENATNFANANCQPLRITEDIVVFSKGGVSPSSKLKTVYNPQGVIEVNKENKRGSVGENYCKTLKNKNIQKYTNHPTNILEFSIDSVKFHPTQKPIALLEYLIKTYTNEGEAILDNTMGSGSTGVAAMNLHRKFIGIELEPQYFEIAQKRIQDIVVK